MDRTGPLLAVALLVPVAAGCIGPPDVLLATTTSTQDSGLLDVLEPAFEQATGQDLGVVAVGSGQALEMGRRGDADVLLVHSPKAERRFMDRGHGLSRTYVFRNRFVLVGPAGDPAGVPPGNVTAALSAIHANETAFVSRGDDSGTHAKERVLWERAGLDPATFSADRYRSTGQGMGPTLLIADEQRAYTLTDEATYRNMTDRVDLEVLVSGDPLLANPYHVIPIHDEGRAFADWLTSDPARQIVRGFTLGGRQVFFLDAP